MLRDHPLDCNGQSEKWPLFVRAESLYQVVQRDRKLYSCRIRKWKEKDHDVASSSSAPRRGPVPGTAHLQNEKSGPQSGQDEPAKDSAG